METEKIKLLPNHQEILDRFIAACRSDERILAAFLGGSYARGTADRYSDLDLYIIISDAAFDDFNTRRMEFLRLLGQPVFAEDFGIADQVFCFFFFANGAEGELGFGRESEYASMHGGPYLVLVDKKDMLAGVEFPGAQADPVEQTEKLRRLVYWFWHDLSHFITAMGRGQLWWAQGQLEALRRYCVNLARMRNNFSDLESVDEPYFKIDKSMPVEQLAALEETFCPMEKDAMLKSGLRLVRVYRELAVPLARAHDIAYPEALERVMEQRLEDLQKARNQESVSAKRLL